MKRFLSIIVLVTIGSVALAQTNDYAEDVASVDAIMAAIYDVISGDADTQRGRVTETEKQSNTDTHRHRHKEAQRHRGMETQKHRP